MQGAIPIVGKTAARTCLIWLRLLYQLGSGFFVVPILIYRVATNAINSSDRCRRNLWLPFFSDARSFSVFFKELHSGKFYINLFSKTLLTFISRFFIVKNIISNLYNLSARS